LKNLFVVHTLLNIQNILLYSPLYHCRHITAPSLHDTIAEPVIINNIERVWSARVHKPHVPVKKQNKKDASSGDRDHILGWTPMGVRFRKGTKCNGVLICVDEDELARFDIREAGYTRKKIDISNIHPHIDSDVLVNESLSFWPTADHDAQREELALKNVKCCDCRLVFEKAAEMRRQQSNCSTSNDECSGFVVGDGDVAVWVYEQNENLPAQRSFPITQSYLDIIIRGCMSISLDFARRFLETTHGFWYDNDKSEEKDIKANGSGNSGDQISNINSHHTWVDDRSDPMYVRADREYSNENGEHIDKLLEEHHQYALKKRVVSNVSNSK